MMRMKRLTIYFSVICPTGKGIAKIIVFKDKTRFIGYFNLKEKV
ncbi:MAG: hypothetical protein K0R19_517 [Bacillota bacterium]|jgi:hypothetical protein|nr:hypothetical protein [Bacillota bacterium]